MSISREKEFFFLDAGGSSENRGAALRELHELPFKDSQKDKFDRRNRPLSTLNHDLARLSDDP